MALPRPMDDGRQQLLRCLDDLVEVVGLDVAPADRGDEWRWGRRVGAAFRKASRQGPLVLPETSFDTLMTAAVYDPDPSFNRWWLEPALNAFGRRRVCTALLAILRTGTDVERAGAARAWYWAALPLRLPGVVAEIAGVESQVEPDDPAELAREWNAAALREFVTNEHLDVRRCIIPVLPLWKSAYGNELHGLLDTAIAIARSHPDEYIRHRVEHQVRS